MTDIMQLTGLSQRTNKKKYSFIFARHVFHFMHYGTSGRRWHRRVEN